LHRLGFIYKIKQQMKLKRFKSILLLGIAGLAALVATEVTVKYLFRFPTYGVEKKVLGIKKSNKYSNIFIPHSEYYNTENGFNIYRRNNLGLYGNDVNLRKTDKLIYLIGDSFVEASQWPPDSMAVSHFQKKMELPYEGYKVINLGRIGHDPFDSYFRLAYFEKKYRPGIAILVISNTYDNWFDRQKHPLSFEISSQFGYELKSLSTKISILLLNRLSIFNLLKQYMNASESIDNKFILDYTETNTSPERIPDDLFICLNAFYTKYRNKFLLISIINDDFVNKELQRYCIKNGINFNWSCINTKENKINKIGHLNLQGNRLLGGLLYDSICKFNMSK
jgi:hypothetical protein